MPSRTTPVLITVLLLAGCHGQSKDQKVSAEIDNTVAADGPNAVAPGLPLSTPTRAAVAAETLPTAFVGRWGLTPGDCDFSRSDAKGLLIVEPRSLRFYESTASIAALDKASPDDVTARLDFKGEGQTWQTTTRLALDAAGTALVRTEQSPPHIYRYSRC
ncbi:hypothetical protein EAH79_16020 [Sphingomonas koreensis]|nr:hypothetical protein EAH79_16020 [Sphingomonas koreensis]